MLCVLMEFHLLTGTLIPPLHVVNIVLFLSMGTTAWIFVSVQQTHGQIWPNLKNAGIFLYVLLLFSIYFFPVD